MFKNIHYQFAAIITCLDDQIKAGVLNKSVLEASDSRIREKADKAMELKGKILNLSFVLNLSGLVDIYEQFGAIVQVTQMVTLLPHERLDKYTRAVQRLKNMALCQDHKNCAQFFSEEEKKKCLWPMNHADKRSYREEKSVRGMAILDQHGVRAAGLSILTRRQKGENFVTSKVDAEKSSDAKLLVVVHRLGAGLSDEVFSVEGKKVIEATRVILDLPTPSSKILGLVQSRCQRLSFQSLPRQSQRFLLTL